MGFDADPSLPPSPPSLMHRLRSSICLSCCFRGAAAAPPDRAPSLVRSSAAWIRAKAPEIGGRCGRSVAAALGIHRARRHPGAGEFRYDPLSYALNFDEGPDDDVDLSSAAAAGGQPFRYRSFSSRLPPSPPRPAVNAAVA